MGDDDADEPRITIEPEKDIADYNRSHQIFQELIAPRLEKGLSIGVIAEELAISEAQVEDLVESWGEDAVAGQLLFREVVSELERHFLFPKAEHARLAALFIFQSHLAKPILPLVFYVGISGPMSAGKTTLLEILRDLSWNGVMSGDVSPAALSRILNQGCTLFVDEADEMDDYIRDLVYGAARRGYRRGSTRIVSVQNGKAWGPQTINIYGAYAFSFYNETDVDPALLSRMVRFEIPRLRTDDVKDRIFLNMARTIIGNTELKERIENFLEPRIKSMTPDILRKKLLDPQFQDRVAKTIKTSDLTRDWELASAMLLTADVIGIDLVSEIRNAFAPEARAAIDEGVLESLEDLKAIFEPTTIKTQLGKSPRMSFEDVRKEWNRMLRGRGDKAVAASEFRRELGRIGLRPGQELIHPKNRSWIVWTPFMESKLSETPSPNSEIALTDYFGNPNPTDDDLTRVRSQVDKVRVIVGIGLGINTQSGEVSPIPETGLTREEIWERVKHVDGLTEKDIDWVLESLIEQRRVYQPKDARYRLT